MPQNNLEDLQLFIPEWFIKAALAGEPEQVIKNLLGENLESAHKLAGREMPPPSEMQEKIDGLFAVYMNEIKEHMPLESKT